MYPDNSRRSSPALTARPSKHKSLRVVKRADKRALKHLTVVNPEDKGRNVSDQGHRAGPIPAFDKGLRQDDVRLH